MSVCATEQRWGGGGCSAGRVRGCGSQSTGLCASPPADAQPKCARAHIPRLSMTECRHQHHPYLCPPLPAVPQLRLHGLQHLLHMAGLRTCGTTGVGCMLSAAPGSMGAAQVGSKAGCWQQPHGGACCARASCTQAAAAMSRQQDLQRRLQRATGHAGPQPAAPPRACNAVLLQQKRSSDSSSAWRAAAERSAARRGLACDSGLGGL